ncbi:MAG: methyltransferase domain-containing protein [Phycisphaerae bacterium]
MREKLITREDTADRPGVEAADHVAAARVAAMRFATVVTGVRVLGHDLPFRRVARPDDALDAAVDAETAGRDVGHPEWADLWKSAWGLIERIEASTASTVSTASPADRLDLSRTLDLGCGQGLLGLAVGLAGGRVVMADYELEALKLAQLNTTVVAGRRSLVQLDWHRPPLAGVFTTILGSDVVYHPPDWPALEALWARHLAPGGVVVLGEPYRATGDGFLNWIAARPWRVAVKGSRREAGVRRIELRAAG